MANIKEQKLRKLKKSYIGGSFAGFIIIGTIVFCLFASLFAVFGLYIMDTKLRDEYARVSKTAEVYSLLKDAGNEAVSRILESGDTVYLITDADMNVIETHGKNTCDLSKGGKIDIIEFTDEVAVPTDEEGIHGHIGSMVEKARDNAITVYPDTEVAIITPSGRGRVMIDFMELRSIISGTDYGSDALSLQQAYFVKLPFWIDIPVDANYHMICKAYFNIYFRELAILSFLAVMVVILTFVTLIFVLAYIIKTVRNRKRMNEIFFMDETTGQHNWLWFITNAERELKKKYNADKKYAVLDVVFVNYRNFCVCHSVEEGGKMLCRINDRIQVFLGKHELTAHHSASHFAVLLEYRDRDELEARIRKMIDDLEHINDEHKFYYWIGVDRIPESRDEKGRVVRRDNIDVEKEFNNAGAARATLTVEDSAIAFFDEKMVEEQRWIDLINENQMRALAAEEFVVFYQPKYDPRTRELKGAEALIRWMSPEHGMISPGRFIPIFEKNGFITKIDHYMLAHVARDQRRWLDAGYDCVPVSVNVSRAHFIESDLAEQIKGIVDDAGTPHDLIEIELTESAFFDDKNALISTIKKLREYGFAVSMDDFGSGYSSLNSLKEMPLDVLKLDADFFRNDDGDGRGQIVVSEAIKLAQNLKMRTVAEGVEEKNQVDFLAEQGCDMIQGFYFAKPMPKDEYEERMNSKTA